MSRACRARWPAISSCSATSGTWCAKASIWRWARRPIGWCWGLPTVGLVVTAATYVSVGGVAPLRAGLTLVKDARKVGRLGEGLTQWAGRSAREVVDAPDAAAGGRLRLGAAAGPDHDARSRRRSAPRRPARWFGWPRTSAGSARRPASARRAGHAAHRRRPEGCRARRPAGGIQGRPDPRDPESARPRRAAAGGRRLQSDDVGVRRAAGAVRLSVVDQGHHRTRSPWRICAARRRGGCASRWRRRPCRPTRLWRAPLAHG